MQRFPAPHSWLAAANGHADFPLNNLPLGIFTYAGSPPTPGVAIADEVLDLAALAGAGLLEGLAHTAVHACAGGTLNGLFALGRVARVALREQLSALLAAGSQQQQAVQACLRPQAECQLQVPARIGDYTDFYVGIEHAKNVGALLRPGNPLLPNYKHVPVGYHGRASTVRASGQPVRRPYGQTLPPGAQAPRLGPSQSLDYELELGIWIGPGNALGEPIGIDAAAGHIAGFCLLNDWSARDIQAWEYQPLGPFLSKSFMTTVSPWVVTPEALAPFRCPLAPRPAGDPQPLPYLLGAADQAEGALDIELQVSLQSDAMREQGLAPLCVAVSNTRHMYWTVAQMLAHHSINGCQLNAGDLFGSGTLSGPLPHSYGSLLELTGGGQPPLRLPSGEVRRFLEDGDEVTLRARCRRDGYGSLGFGECRGRVVTV